MAARLIARQVDAATALRLRDALQCSLQDLGGGAVKASTWQRELERLVQQLLHPSVQSPGHALCSPALVLRHIRDCRARFPGIVPGALEPGS